MKIKNKNQFYELYEKGAFGNKLRTYSSYNEYLSSDYNGNVTLRYKGEAGSRKNFFVPKDRVASLIDEWIDDGLDIDNIKINESAPDDHLLIQGEILKDKIWYFKYSKQINLPMSTAMENADFITGLNVLEYLKYYMSDCSFGDFMDLMDEYGENIIELSIYDKFVGNLPGRNTIIWEVRSY